MKQNNSNRCPILLVILLLVFVSMPGHLKAFKVGKKLSFYITNDFLYQNNRLSNNKNQLYETLTLFASYDNWSLGVSFRGNNFLKQTPNVSLQNLETDLYRKYIQYNSKHLKITIGDFYSMLGRGMVLSVLKNDDILRERTILGGDVRFNKGNVNLRALGGRIKDETENQEWTVFGGEAELEFVTHHKAGAHFSFIDDLDTQMQPGKHFTYSFSLQGNKLFNTISYYSEVAFLSHEEAAKDNGLGIYSNVTYNKNHVTFSLEFKRYKDFFNQMNNPPIADREDEISSVNDTTGARLLIQYAFWEPDIILSLNFGRYKEYNEEGNHIYGEIAAEDLWDRFNFSLTYGVRDIIYAIKRLNFNLIYQFNDRWSVEMGLNDRRYKDNQFIFKEIDHNLQFSFSPYASIFFLHQYSHNKIIGLNHFYSGGVKIYLAGGTAVEFSGGTIRGGQICSGGQCYVAPPFRGVKFSLLHTFN